MIKADPCRDLRLWRELLRLCWEIETLEAHQGMELGYYFEAWKEGSLWHLWLGGELISRHQAPAGLLLRYTEEVQRLRDAGDLTGDPMVKVGPERFS